MTAVDTYIKLKPDNYFPLARVGFVKLHRVVV